MNREIAYINYKTKNEISIYIKFLRKYESLFYYPPRGDLFNNNRAIAEELERLSFLKITNNCVIEVVCNNDISKLIDNSIKDFNTLCNFLRLYKEVEDESHISIKCLKADGDNLDRYIELNEINFMNFHFLPANHKTYKVGDVITIKDGDGKNVNIHVIENKIETVKEHISFKEYINDKKFNKLQYIKEYNNLKEYLSEILVTDIAYIIFEYMSK